MTVAVVERPGVRLGELPQLLDVAEWGAWWSAERWRETLEYGVRDAAFLERLREATRRGRPLGSAEFVEHLERSLGRRLQPQKRGPKPRKTVQTAGVSVLG